MKGTSLKHLRIIQWIIVLLTTLTYPVLAEDIKVLTKRAEGGDPEAQFELGRAYEKGWDIPMDDVEAAKWYREAAGQGNSKAQNNLGILLKDGKGLARNDIEAVKWFRKSAEQGNSEAQNNLGVSYLSGRGVFQNDAEGARWIKKAAEQGNPGAQKNLGIIYAHGLGEAGKVVPLDYTLSYFWLSLYLSNARGMDFMQMRRFREDVAENLSPEQLKKAEQMYWDWQKKHLIK